MPVDNAVEVPESGLRIAEVRVQDVRAIADLCVPLAELTVLVGENNVGKTSFLRALDLAIGAVPPVTDDFRVPELGGRVAEFIIDLKLVPFGEAEEFDDALAVRLGDAVQLPGAGSQFATIRARGTAGLDGAEPRVELRFVAGWECDRGAALQLSELERLSPDQRRLISFFLLDARRDIVDELRQRRSYWGRLMTDIGIDDADRAALEAQLATLGSDVVAKSSVLRTLRDELDRVREALGSAVSAVSIEAIPARIDEVARSVDVLLKAPGSAALPLRVQGMGSRSLAVVMVFQAFSRLRLGVDQDIRPLSIAAFEEPEAHLHPHPQRAMFNMIRGLPGQKLISTHSPYVTQVADLFDLRVFTRDGGTIVCRRVPTHKSDGSPTFEAEGAAKARRFVQKNNGEVLFARCVILYEGDTEDGALAVFARERWGIDATVHGVSLIEAQGAGNFKHFVAVLEALGIPWLVLVDGDPAGVSAIAGIKNQLGRPPSASEVFSVPGNEDFERNLLSEGFQDEVERSIGRLYGATALGDYRALLHGQPKKGGVARDYKSAGWERRVVEDFCLENMKSALGGATIAEEINASVAAGVHATIPTAITNLLTRADAIIGLTP